MRDKLHWLLWALLLVPSPAYATAVGVVDVPRALKATADFGIAKQWLERQKEQRTSQIDEKETERKSRRQQIDAKKAVSTAEAVAEEERVWQAEVQQLSRSLMMARQQMMMLEQGVNQRLLARIQAAVQVVAAQKDLDFVFDRGADAEPNVLFSVSSVDITDAVVDVYKQKFKDQPLQLEEPPAF
jgi:Skp family chaperone for outer membrane proteins